MSLLVVNVPVAPKVLIDQGLPVASLEFNYPAFYRFAKRAGLTDKQVASYTIHFTKASHGNLAGHYSVRKRTATIYLSDILQASPASSGHLHSREHSLAPDEQYSRVLSRIVAHETGHHSRSGRSRALVADAGASGLLATPVAAAGVGTLYTSLTGSFTAPLLAVMAETTAVATLSYRQAKRYRTTQPEKVFSYHRSRFSEKPAYAAEAYSPSILLVKIHLQ